MQTAPQSPNPISGGVGPPRSNARRFLLMGSAERDSNVRASHPTWRQGRCCAAEPRTRQAGGHTRSSGGGRVALGRAASHSQRCDLPSPPMHARRSRRGVSFVAASGSCPASDVNRLQPPPAAPFRVLFADLDARNMSTAGEPLDAAQPRASSPAGVPCTSLLRPWAAPVARLVLMGASVTCGERSNVY